MGCGISDDTCCWVDNVGVGTEERLEDNNIGCFACLEELLPCISSSRNHYLISVRDNQEHAIILKFCWS